jgi:hypothetical protein
MGKITRLVVLSSELPSELHLLIYELHADVTIKETCYGMLIYGEDAAQTAAVGHVLVFTRSRKSMRCFPRLPVRLQSCRMIHLLHRWRSRRRSITRDR